MLIKRRKKKKKFFLSETNFFSCQFTSTTKFFFFLFENKLQKTYVANKWAKRCPPSFSWPPLLLTFSKFSLSPVARFCRFLFSLVKFITRRPAIILREKYKEKRVWEEFSCGSSTSIKFFLYLLPPPSQIFFPPANKSIKIDGRRLVNRLPRSNFIFCI